MSDEQSQTKPKELQQEQVITDPLDHSINIDVLFKTMEQGVKNIIILIKKRKQLEKMSKVNKLKNEVASLETDKKIAAQIDELTKKKEALEKEMGINKG